MIAATVALVLGAASILSLGAAWLLIGGPVRTDTRPIGWDYSIGGF